MRTKILLLVAILICSTFILNAQINAGRYLVGGSVYFRDSKISESLTTWKSLNLNSNLQFGKVVKENTVVGLILSYGYSKYTYPNSPDSNKSHYYGAGVFYRKYKKLAKDLYFFGQANAEYSRTEYTQQNIQNGLQSYKMVSDGVSVSFVPGISYAIGKRMQIDYQ